MENDPKSYDSSTLKYSEDRFAYKGWMNSDKFLKRAFGVFGYQMAAGCIVQAVVMVIVLFFTAILGGFGAMMSN